MEIFANDKFIPLYNFWTICKTDNESLTDDLYKRVGFIEKDDFIYMRNTIMEETDTLQQSIMYFIINRCSFSGATLSGGFSAEASKKRFTKSSVDRVKKLNLCKFEIRNQDFEDFINENYTGDDLMFLDPPYYLEKKSKLYGNNGDMHENFDHKKLFACLTDKKNWIMTYNNCDYVKELYKDFTKFETNWSYGMNKSKKSSELIILAYKQD